MRSTIELAREAGRRFLNEAEEQAFLNGFGERFRSLVEAEKDAEIAELQKDAALVKDLHALAAQDVIFFSSWNSESGKHDDGAYPVVFCSDTFAYACADAEGMQLEDAPMVRRLYKQFGYDGVVAWCAKRRGAAPLKEHLTPAYYAAQKEIDHILAQKENGK